MKIDNKNTLQTSWNVYSYICAHVSKTDIWKALNDCICICNEIFENES